MHILIRIVAADTVADDRIGVGTVARIEPSHRDETDFDEQVEPSGRENPVSADFEFDNRQHTARNVGASQTWQNRVIGKSRVPVLTDQHRSAAEAVDRQVGVADATIQLGRDGRPCTIEAVERLERVFANEVSADDRIILLYQRRVVRLADVGIANPGRRQYRTAEVLERPNPLQVDHVHSQPIRRFDVDCVGGKWYGNANKSATGAEQRRSTQTGPATDRPFEILSVGRVDRPPAATDTQSVPAGIADLEERDKLRVVIEVDLRVGADPVDRARHREGGVAVIPGGVEDVKAQAAEPTGLITAVGVADRNRFQVRRGVVVGGIVRDQPEVIHRPGHSVVGFGQPHGLIDIRLAGTDYSRCQ